MDADLYINECSFRYNGEDTSDNVIRKILLFGDMIDEIRQHKDNRMFCEKENLCDTVIFPDKRKVSDIIYNQYRDKFVNRDFVNVFMKIFNLCKQKVRWSRGWNVNICWIQFPLLHQCSKNSFRLSSIIKEKEW